MTTRSMLIMAALALLWMPLKSAAQDQPPATPLTYTYLSHQDIMATLQQAVQPDTDLEKVITGPDWTAVEVPVSKLLAKLREAAIHAGLTATDVVLLQLDVSGRIELVTPQGLFISVED